MKKIDSETLEERTEFFQERFGAEPKRSAVQHAWRTKDGREIPFRQLSNAHLVQLARTLRRQPRMRQAHLIRKELLRRGMGAHLQPSYPEL